MTCIGDFIHVSDLARAHPDALRHLLAGDASTTLNCGCRRGYSVPEVPAGMGRLSGRLDDILRAAPAFERRLRGG